MQRSFSVSVIDKENVNTSPTMQINSPLEQMTLASPSCSSSIDSQGYFSDVFELQDTTSDDTLPKDFSSLLSSSLTKEDIPMKRTSLKVLEVPFVLIYCLYCYHREPMLTLNIAKPQRGHHCVIRRLL
jgi:hypothetical protein